MSPNIVLCLLCGVLVGSGVVLLLARSLVRALFGVLLMGNGVNLLFLVASGRPGRPPLVSKDALDPPIGDGGISDPLPQAMVLTAIVITLAVTAFTLALAHRSWQLKATDVVADDSEGVRAHDAAVRNDLSDSDYLDSSDPHALPEDCVQAAPGSSHPEADPAADEEPCAEDEAQAPDPDADAPRASGEPASAGEEDPGVEQDSDAEQDPDAGQGSSAGQDAGNAAPEGPAPGRPSGGER